MLILAIYSKSVSVAISEELLLAMPVFRAKSLILQSKRKYLYAVVPP